mmetsp:Transcript_14556/g.25587  ORF Transcript_14556/g.25587 Transcript_14556/m.25587 type:complete len:424 (+) Transcript_14556:665-1936(+)
MLTSSTADRLAHVEREWRVEELREGSFRDPAPATAGWRGQLTPRSLASNSPLLRPDDHGGATTPASFRPGVENSPASSPSGKDCYMPDSTFRPGVENSLGFGPSSPGGSYDRASLQATLALGDAAFCLGVENSPGDTRSLCTARSTTFRPGVENSIGNGGASMFSSVSSSTHGRKAASSELPHNFDDGKDEQIQKPPPNQKIAEEGDGHGREMAKSRPISSNSSRLLELVKDGILSQDEYELALLEIEVQFVSEFPEARPVWIQCLPTSSRRTLLAKITSYLRNDWQLPESALLDLKMEWGFNDTQSEAARLWALGVNMYIAPASSDEDIKPVNELMMDADRTSLMPNELGSDCDEGSLNWGVGITQHYKVRSDMAPPCFCLAFSDAARFPGLWLFVQKTLMRRTISRSERAKSEVLRKQRPR